MDTAVYSRDAPTSATAPMAIDDTRFRYFREALRNESPATLGVAESTYWRWMAGDLPKFVEVLMERPHLAKALYRDASEGPSTDDGEE